MDFNVKNVNVEKTNSSVIEKWVYDAEWNKDVQDPVTITYSHIGIGDVGGCITDGEIDLTKVFLKKVIRIENLRINGVEYSKPAMIARLPVVDELKDLVAIVTRTALHILDNGQLNGDEAKNL